MRIKILVTLVVVVLTALNTSIAQHIETKYELEFRNDNSTLYDKYENNHNELKSLERMVAYHEDVILTGSGHIRIVANIPRSEKDNLIAINMGALRASVISSYLRGKFRFMTRWNFTFHVNITDGNPNSVEVCYIPTPIALDAPKNIYYSTDRNNINAIKVEINKYGGIPYLTEEQRAQEYELSGIDVDKQATGIVAPAKNEADSQEVLIAIYYRWDKSNLDSMYLGNAQHLKALDSILTSKNAKYIDTLTIVAFASPEGHPDYNKRLSERRANTIRQYIVDRYPTLNPDRIATHAHGENWQGVLKFAKADKNLPSRGEVLEILESNMTDLARQRALTALDGGSTYYRYILPNYYRYLRNGASLLITYTPQKVEERQIIVAHEPDSEPQSKEERPREEPTVELEPITAICEPQYRYIRPFALKTNLLFDAATLLNVELEIPIGRHFSVMGEWTFPWWGGLGNRGGVSPVPVYSEKYTLEMLSAGIEIRYWFKRSDRSDQKAQRWGDYNPLCGWFIGPYAGYGLYDFQFGKDGIQGDFYIAAGLSGGFAHPIGRYFHMEYSVGVGYVKTQYKNYTPMDGHKVYQYDGRYTWLGPTKAKVSLIWIPRFKVNDKKGYRK